MATERPLNREEQHAIASGLASIIATWGLDQSAPPRDLLAWVQAHLDRIKDGEVACPDEDGIVAIGVLLGTQYIRRLGWRWALVTWDDGAEAHSVVSHDSSIVITPLNWVYGILKGEEQTNVLLNFNMVEGGAVSWAAGSYTIFS